ncbi:Retrovirus-related Pol polyprotein from transposon 17.6 [Stylophora pistillata]|uniref:Retrovirus-related Pol polyprotein from transposon 17.6 n=1 Tax=Stylophora pistillata TaxID=50429 RepID=A0A2B4R704_STYPI|nr:Retrovirus-related Pol polyprotein from transposon 17.6 [Stylophora pistillata]
MPIGKIEAFDETNDDWLAYVERVEQYFLANDIKEDKQVAVMLSLMGNKTYGLLRNLSAPEKPSSLSFKTIVETLQKHLSPKPLLIAERFRFHKRNQLEGETVSTYIAELKKLTLYCEFGASLNDALRDRLVCGLHNELIQKRLLSEPELTLAKATEIAFAMEAAAKDTLELQGSKESDVNKINTENARTDALTTELQETLCLVVDDLRESVSGADFIESHHESLWGIRDGALWLDDWKIPLVDHCKCSSVLVENYFPVVARCTVELPARSQVLIPMRTKDRDCRGGFFESTRAPGGVLITKTVVDSDKNGRFWVKAVNLSDESVTLFKNQKVGIITDIAECSDPVNSPPYRDGPIVSSITKEPSKGNLEEFGIDLSAIDLSCIQRGQLEDLLLSYADVFSRGKRDIGKYTAGVQHHIPLKAGATPVKQQLRRVPFAYQEGVKSDSKDMFEDGVIERSTSEWASPLVIARKPSGDLRICVNYDLRICVNFFTTIDMVSSYHQIEVAPEDRHKTAFVSPFGLFQYCRLPFGLARAPGMFQAVIEDMLQVLDTNDVMAYLDDVICFHSVPPHDLHNKSELVWTPQCDCAFKQLEEILWSSVILKLPDRLRRFTVSCDASNRAVGFVLEHSDDSGSRRPVAFGGRRLDKSECNYSTTEKECLAVIEAIKAYHPYLLGREFDLFTDHESLKWLLTRTKERSGRLWRWVEKFREFQCKVYQIAGSRNIVADALTSSPESVDNVELRAFLKEWLNLSLGKDGILRRRSIGNPGSGHIVVPRNLTPRVLQILHDNLGKFGTTKTSVRVKERIFWPPMSFDIEEWCRNCLPCQRRKNSVLARRALLQPIISCRPGEMLKPFEGGGEKGQGGVVGETGPTEVSRPSPTQVGSDAGVIVLEDDIFPEAVVEAPSEDHLPVQHPPQAEEPVRRSQRERHPPFWTRGYQMDT